MNEITNWPQAVAIIALCAAFMFIAWIWLNSR